MRSALQFAPQLVKCVLSKSFDANRANSQRGILSKVWRDKALLRCLPNTEWRLWGPLLDNVSQYGGRGYIV